MRLWRTRALALALGLIGAASVYGSNLYAARRKAEASVEEKRQRAIEKLRSIYQQEKNERGLGDLQQLVDCQNRIRKNGLDTVSFDLLLELAGDPKRDRAIRQRALSALVKPLRDNQIKMNTPEMARVQALYRGMLGDEHWTIRYGGLAFLAGFRDAREVHIVRDMQHFDPDKRVRDLATSILKEWQG